MKKHQEGQSTVEFIFAFVFGVSIILMVFNSSMNYISGYLAHYATFMASRAYLVQDSFLGVYQAEASLSGAEGVAREVFSTYNLGIFGIKPTDMTINRVNGPVSASDYYKVGAKTIFEKNIDLVGKIVGEKKVKFVTESYLGKEPTRNVCAMRVCKAITNSEACNLKMDITLFDDGC
jgi:hypothetical protein